MEEAHVPGVLEIKWRSLREHSSTNSDDFALETKQSRAFKLQVAEFIRARNGVMSPGEPDETGGLSSKRRAALRDSIALDNIISPHQRSAGLKSKNRTQLMGPSVTNKAVPKQKALQTHRVRRRKSNEETSHGQWQSTWETMFRTDQLGFKSTHIFLESKLHELDSHLDENSIYQDAGFRAAAFCELLNRACPALGQFAPILARIRDELFSLIYLDAQADVQYRTPYFEEYHKLTGSYSHGPSCPIHNICY